MCNTKLLILSFLFVIACQNQVKHSPKFAAIDKKLNRVAKQLGVKVSAEVGGYSFDGKVVPKSKLESRKIVWTEDSIGKGIFIHQNFTNKNINAPDWDFIVVAWLTKRNSGSEGSPFWLRKLLEKVTLTEIESKLDGLLKQSLDSLRSIKTTDLGYDNY